MSDARRTRWNELLDVPNELAQPDLYQILGTTRTSFDPSRLEESFRERMARLQSTRSTKHKEFVEFAKAELRRARRVLGDEAERAAYDREVLAERAQDMRRFIDVALACGPFSRDSERAVVAGAVDLGLTEDEARAALEAELDRRNAGVPAAKLPGFSAKPSSRTRGYPSGLEPLPLDNVSDSAPELEPIEDHVPEPEPEARARKRSKKSGKRPSLPKSGSRAAKVSDRQRKLAAEAAGETRPCANCKRELPSRWRELAIAERIGTRLLCAACAATVRANEACAACSRPLGPLDGHVWAGAVGRLCDTCVENVTRLKVCASCELVLPPIAFERGDAQLRGKLPYCKDCLARLT